MAPYLDSKKNADAVLLGAKITSSPFGRQKATKLPQQYAMDRMQLSNLESLLITPATTPEQRGSSIADYWRGA